MQFYSNRQQRQKNMKQKLLLFASDSLQRWIMNNSIGHAVVGVFMDWLLCQGEQLRVKWDAISIPWSWNE